MKVAAVHLALRDLIRLKHVGLPPGVCRLVWGEVTALGPLTVRVTKP